MSIQTGKQPDCSRNAQKKEQVEVYALFYLYCTDPGASNMCGNICLHGKLFRFLEGKQEFNKELDKMLEMLKFRLNDLVRADELAKIMGVANNAFDAYSFNEEYWRPSKEEKKMDSFAWRLLIDSEIREKKGHFWPKPYKFLSACLATSGLNEDKIRQRVDSVHAGAVLRCHDILLQKMKSLGYEVQTAFHG